MDRLAIYISVFITGATITGACLVALFSFGWYGWTPVILSLIVGAALAYPTGLWCSRRIKRKDPHFDETKPRKGDGVLPDPSAPEI